MPLQSVHYLGGTDCDKCQLKEKNARLEAGLQDWFQKYEYSLRNHKNAINEMKALLGERHE